MSSDFDKNWSKLSGEVLSELKEWRIQHPKATLKEIERAVDERLGRMRARLMEDRALASNATALNKGAARAKSKCPECGIALKAGGKHRRRLTTNYDQSIELLRSYGQCPNCKVSFFPLDEELGLLPNVGFTPRLAESMTRLGSWMLLNGLRHK
jgi:hypothetical protein